MYLTYVIQELLKKNILGANSIYLSLCHTEKEIDNYLTILEKIFYNLNKIVKSNAPSVDYLEIPPISEGFARLT